MKIFNFLLVILATVMFLSCGDENTKEDIKDDTKDLCAKVDCGSHGECKVVELNYLYKAVCVCDSGYEGENCETEVEIKGCETNPCLNDGTCIEASEGYNCECKAGFEGNNCETKVEIKTCEENPCLNNGVCVDGDKGYSCNCIDDFAGKNCEFADANSFVTIWKTDNIGASGDNEVEIPVITSDSSHYNNEVYNYNVDCDNDGVFEVENHNSTYKCIYDNPGTYTVRITGDFPRIYFGINKDSNKLLSVEQWGNLEFSSMAYAFFNCSNLEINAVDAPNLSNVKDMSNMFKNAISFNQNINHWDVSNIENMTALFYFATKFNQDLSSWNTIKVTSMKDTFYHAESFNGDISSWKVENVIDMSHLFYFASSFNQDISSWLVNKVENMTEMFYFASSFNQDLSSWNITNVESCSDFFDDDYTWTSSKPNFTSCSE